LSSNRDKAQRLAHSLNELMTSPARRVSALARVQGKPAKSLAGAGRSRKKVAMVKEQRSSRTGRGRLEATAARRQANDSAPAATARLIAAADRIFR